MAFTLRDSASLRDPVFTRQFLIGAELELYARRPDPLPAPPTAAPLATAIPADVKARYGHLFKERDKAKEKKEKKRYGLEKAQEDILALLGAGAPDIPWEGRLSFTADGSLVGPREGEAGVEIILRHMPGPQALVTLGALFRILGSASHLRANEHCGLHLNASFASPQLNTIATMAHAHEHIPVAKLLSAFGRSSNLYCLNNAGSTLELDDIFEDPDEAVSLLAKSLGGSKRIRDVSLSAFSEMVNSLASPAKLAAFQESLMGLARAAQLSRWEDDRPACAPRLYDVSRDSPRSRSSNYMEFRMMGGVDYIKRPRDVAAGIELCLKGLLASAELHGPALAPKEPMTRHQKPSRAKTR